VTVLVDGYTFFECPRWHDGRFWVSDFYTRSVLAVSLDGQVEQILTVEGQPSGLGWLPDGDLLVVSMKDQKVLRVHDGSASVHADLSGLAKGHLNDMVVDAAGRAYVGAFGFDLMAGDTPVPSVVVRIDPDGRAVVAADDMLFPNGTVVTPDGGTIIVAESLGQRLTAFSVQADGSLADRRVWASLGSGRAEDALAAAAGGGDGSSVTPDGTSLDAEGCVWVADASGMRAVRVREGGEIVDEVGGDGLNVYACGLGGDDGRTLVLCAAPTFAESEASTNRRAKLLTATVDVPHAGLP
jgi:sugar lactone lactonase YvrE